MASLGNGSPREKMYTVIFSIIIFKIQVLQGVSDHTKNISIFS